MKKNQIAQPKSDRGRNQTCDPVKVKENSGFNKKGYKKTKLGWIPEEWEIKELNEIGKVVSGLTYSPKDIDDNGILVLRSSNIQNDRLSFEDNVFVNVDSLKFNPVQDRDILICVRNGSKNLIGKNALITKKEEGVAFGAFMAVYRSELNNYLIHYFKTDFYNNEIHKNLGATINSINGSELNKFKVPLPPLPEQQKIATILSTWDRAIAKQQQLIAAKQEYKKGLMQLLLTGKLRFAGFEGEWEKVRLKELGELIGGGTPSTKVPEFWNGEIPWVSSSDLTQNNLFDLNISRFITQEAIEKSATKLIPAYSILIVSRVGIGKLAINNHEVCTSQDFTSLIPDRGDLIFLGYKIQSIIGRLISHNQGTSIKGFTKKSLKNLKFEIPLIKEQQKIATVLRAAGKEIRLLEDELVKLQEQKRGLMQRLLTGEVRVKNRLK